MEQFLIPAGEGTSEYMEKKSRFLGLIAPVTTEAEARARLEAVCPHVIDDLAQLPGLLETI